MFSVGRVTFGNQTYGMENPQLMSVITKKEYSSLEWFVNVAAEFSVSYKERTGKC